MEPSALDSRSGTSYRIRQVLGPWINRFSRVLGPKSYHIRRTEYVGTVDRPIDDLEAELRANGFTWAPFSLYHRTPMETSTDGSWSYRSSALADRQLHVVLFTQTPERVDIYAHLEYNWLRHPIRHARQIDIRREEGARRMRRWLDAQGMEYDHEWVIRRKTAHLFERFRERLFGRDSLPG